MDRPQVLAYLRELKEKQNVRVYTPYKYFQGLTTKTQIRSRFNDILKGRASKANQPSSYQGFKTDYETKESSAKPLRKSTKPSSYTVAFQEMYGTSATSLVKKSQVTGVPLDILRKVFHKGKAAWRTGHRVGATEEQWGYARVHSFLMLGCTVFSADFSLFEEALPRMKPKDRKKWLSLPVRCPQTTLQSPHYLSRQTYVKFLALKKKYVVKPRGRY